MHRPVFIGGAGRSGTTLAVDLLGTHEQLSPIYETWIVQQLLVTLGKRLPVEALRRAVVRDTRLWIQNHLMVQQHNKRAHERYRHGPHHLCMTPQDVEARLAVFVRDLPGRPVLAFRQFINGIFADHARRDGKPFWVNKTPIYARMAPALHTVWPGMLFVHCVRDGRDVAASVLTRSWGPSTWVEAAHWWAGAVKAAQAFGQAHPEAYVELRYEDVLGQPRQAVAATLSRMSLGGTDALLARYTENGFAFDPARSGAWKKADPEGVLAFEEIYGDLLQQLGYPLSTAPTP